MNHHPGETGPPVRIGFLCSEFPPDSHGGIGVYTRELACALAQRGHRVFVVGWSDRNATEEEDGIHVHRIRRPSLGRFPHLALLSSYRKLANSVRSLAVKWKLDIVEAPDYRGESAFFTDFPCPVVIRGHGSVGVLSELAGRKASRLISHLEGRALRVANGRSSVSRFLEDRTTARWSLKDHGTIIPNFIDRHRFSPASEVARDPLRLVIVGRLGRAKGMDTMLPILRRVLEGEPRATLELVGEDRDGLVVDFLNGMEESLAKRIVHVGTVPREELARVYTRAAIVIIPARAETFSLVALEAMACGCVPVAWKESGPGEYLAEHGLGRLVGDDDEWAKVILSLLGDTNELESMGERCQEVVASTFSTEIVVPMLENLYTRHVEKWRAGC
ncbi:MAG: glycosyltransferase family 4 protein [Candidatus Sumerlaeia bacterium]|nr:glycosyltransferase family 4 protein [Candidatus Sumerlaeia bacterium]